MSTIKNLLAKIEAYPFESEGGPLHLCTDWTDLKSALENIPEFQISQRVQIKVSGKIDGIDATIPVIVWVCAIRLASRTDSTWLEYGVTPDLTAPYHYGQQAKWWRKASEISLPMVSTEMEVQP